MGVSLGVGVPDGIGGGGVGLVGALGSFQSAMGQFLLVAAANTQGPSYTGSGAMPDRRRPAATVASALRRASAEHYPLTGVRGQQLGCPQQVTSHSGAIITGG